MLKNRVGEERVISKFLFLPTTINNISKWLTYESIIQRVTLCSLPDNSTVAHWANVSWTK